MWRRKVPFVDREDAGRRLAERLVALQPVRPLVLALPRGGVPIGFAIARALKAPLDLVLVRKIGAPGQPELAVGAVVDGSRPETVLNQSIARQLQLSEAWLERETALQLAEIERRRQRYFAGLERTPVAGRTAILVDDGIATGATMEAALHATRRAKPQKLVLAVPVAPPDALERLGREADAVICLESPRDFMAVGEFYEDFTQVEGETVVELLRRAAAEASKK